MNNDGAIDVSDLVEVILNWGPCAAFPCRADVTGDQVVDVSDLIEIILNWGMCP